MIFGKKLTTQELGELRALERIIREEQFKVALVEKNTIVVKGAKEYAERHRGIIQLLGNEKENFISKCAHRLGFEGPVSLNLETGKIWNRKA